MKSEMNPGDLVRRLGRVEHFRDLPEGDLCQIVHAGRIRRVFEGAVIFQEHEPCAGLFVLLQGQIQIYRQDEQGHIAILAVIDPVIMFNEVAALDGGTNPVSAVATLDSVLWNTSAAELQSLVLSHPQIGLGLLRILARRNRHLVDRFHDLSFRTVLARTAKLLLELSRDGQEPIDRRRHSNGELAARIATVPEAFSRALKVFRDSGALTCQRSIIQVVDPQQLQEMVCSGLSLP